MASVTAIGQTALQGKAAELSRLARAASLDYTADGGTEAIDGGIDGASTFEDALLKAMDGVNASQAASTDILQRMSVDPESVDVQDVTIAMAEANMSLNLAKTILSRVVTAWKEVINIR